MKLFLSLFSVLLLHIIEPANLEKQNIASHLLQTPEMPLRGLCAHRGAMATHPENTLSAFKAAIAQGAHMIEFDVHLSKDKELVIIHDDTVDRTTDGKGKVADLTLQELRSLDAGKWKGLKFTGEKIPTLAQTLEMMPDNIWLNVHVKSTSGIGQLVAQEIVKQGRLHQAFMACSHQVAVEAKSISPDVLICNMDRQSSNWDYIDLTVESGSDFIQLRGDITTEFLKIAQYLVAKGIRINYFGTDHPEEISMLFDYGIHFPLVNNIVESMKTCRALGIAPLQPVFRRE
jgi:glycerophosphoryl diester phosphodiesterase